MKAFLTFAGDLPLAAQIGPQNLWELDDCINTMNTLRLTADEIAYLQLKQDFYK